MSTTGGNGGTIGAGNVKLFRDAMASFSNYGTQVAPAANTAIAVVGGLAAGTYEITAYCAYGATADVQDNFRVQINGTNQITPLVASVINGQPAPVTGVFTVGAGGTAAIVNSAAGAAGSVYRALLVIRQVA